MLQAVLLEIVKGMRTGPDQTHFSSQHVPKLRQFVQAILPQELTYSRNSRVIINLEEWSLPFVLVTQCLLHFLCISLHGPKFVARKRAALLPDPTRSIKHGSVRVKFDPSCDHNQNGAANHKGYRRYENIKDTLYEEAQRRNRLPMQIHYRKIADLMDWRVPTQSVI